MRLTATQSHSTRGNRECEDAAEAVQVVIYRNMLRYDGSAEREAAKTEALQGMLGRLIGVLIANGTLRAEQVSEIFDYDVIAEYD